MCYNDSGVAACLGVGGAPPGSRHPVYGRRWGACWNICSQSHSCWFV